MFESFEASERTISAELMDASESDGAAPLGPDSSFVLLV